MPRKVASWTSSSMYLVGNMKDLVQTQICDFVLAHWTHWLFSALGENQKRHRNPSDPSCIPPSFYLVDLQRQFHRWLSPWCWYDIISGFPDTNRSALNALNLIFFSAQQNACLRAPVVAPKKSSVVFSESSYNSPPNCGAGSVWEPFSELCEALTFD